MTAGMMADGAELCNGDGEGFDGDAFDGDVFDADL